MLVPPRIVIPPQKRISLNESQRLQLFCNATGVPEPTIYWLKDGQILRVIGDHLSISDVTYTDRGKYTCTADNGINPNVSESSDVTIYCKYRYKLIVKYTLDLRQSAYIEGTERVQARRSMSSLP